MWSSKDVACIICMAALSFVSTVLVGQMATLITGLHGANYCLTIIYAILTGFSMLIYEGRRWRFLTQYSIFTLLIIPTHLSGSPFALPTKFHFMLTAFVIDLLFNTFYKTARSRGKMMLWSVSGVTLFYLLMPSFSLLIRPLFYSPEAVAVFANMVLMLLPVIIVESIVGGYLGYKIHRRLRKEC
ncbi:hypothetical protein E2P63_00645 [Candidatus Bathyarchaeota archaeon]|nr:hypothetical protein E2P63_00645 [Candidatus Bathyarchaeota archaeon]